MTSRTHCFLALFSAAAMLAPGAMAQEYTFRLHHFLPAVSPTHTDTIEPWVERVEENSDGRVSIEIFPSMTLGGRPPELFSQVRDGVVDMIWVVNGYTPGLFPRTEVFELPNVFKNDPAASNLAMREMFESDLAEEYRGVEIMFLHVHAGNGLQMTDTAVNTPDDLLGKRLRTPSRTGAWVIEALGAAPVSMPVPDLPQALSRNVVDGALIPWEIGGPLRLAQQTEYQIEGEDKLRFGTTVFQLSMNQARWDSLPPDIQQAFRDASDEAWLQELGEVWRANDDRVNGEFIEAGNTHITLSPEETSVFVDAMEPVVERWVEDVSANGVDGAALVEKARTSIEQHSSGGT